MYVQSCFTSLTYYFFDVLVAGAVVIAKAPYFWQGYLLSAWPLLQQDHQFGEYTQTYPFHCLV